jgi:hypothetical protein
LTDRFLYYYNNLYYLGAKTHKTLSENFVDDNGIETNGYQIRSKTYYSLIDFYIIIIILFYLGVKAHRTLSETVIDFSRIETNEYQIRKSTAPAFYTSHKRSKGGKLLLTSTTKL